MVPFEHVIALSALLFGVGLFGALLRRSLLVILLCVELMLSASMLALLGFNRLWAAAPDGSPLSPGQAFALVLVAVASAQIAVGLGIFVSLHRNRESLNVEDLDELRW